MHAEAEAVTARISNAQVCTCLAIKYSPELPDLVTFRRVASRGVLTSSPPLPGCRGQPLVFLRC